MVIVCVKFDRFPNRGLVDFRYIIIKMHILNMFLSSARDLSARAVVHVAV